jgi:hypothetical protein
MSAPTPLPTPLVDLGNSPEDRTLPGTIVRVQLADGSDFSVRVSNRELVAWDMTRAKRSWPLANEARFLCMTFCAWKAATREGKTTLGWDAWQDAVEDIEEAGEVEARPTSPGHEQS